MENFAELYKKVCFNRFFFYFVFTNNYRNSIDVISIKNNSCKLLSINLGIFIPCT